MPYIPEPERHRYEGVIQQSVELLTEKLPGENGKGFIAGDLNFILSSIVWRLFDKKPSYTNGNTLVGVLECVKQEFLRRRLNGYEDEKIKTNGDL